MLPKQHFYIGVIFSIILLPFVEEEINLFILMFGNFFIDVDHYITACVNSKRLLTMKEAYTYCFENLNSFHLFHTMEFHSLVVLAAVFIHPAFAYVFIGMALHTMTDHIMLVKNNTTHNREYFLYKWIIKKCQQKQ